VTFSETLLLVVRDDAHYSVRRLIIGSTYTACRAGSQVAKAAIATTTSAITTPTAPRC
jgi:hypothetical protein